MNATSVGGMEAQPQFTGIIGARGRDKSRKAKGEDEKRKKPAMAGAVEMPLTCVVIAVGLGYAWMQRNEGYLAAENGPGYYLGIVGGVLMLLLLIYPLRKRVRALRVVGEVRLWFRVHMLLGIFGPALVVLHSNFLAGSLNSAVALYCMLVVSGSGFIGRFLYGRIHRGLYGRRLHVKEFLQHGEIFRLESEEDKPAVAGIVQSLQEHEERRLSRPPGFLSMIGRAGTARIARRRARNRVIREMAILINQHGNREGHSKAERLDQLSVYGSYLDRFLGAVSKAETFLVYERMFAMWHMLHLPLFIILVIAAVVHVVAVHLY